MVGDPQRLSLHPRLDPACLQNPEGPGCPRRTPVGSNHQGRPLHPQKVPPTESLHQRLRWPFPPSDPHQIHLRSDSSGICVLGEVRSITSASHSGGPSPRPVSGATSGGDGGGLDFSQSGSSAQFGAEADDSGMSGISSVSVSDSSGTCPSASPSRSPAQSGASRLSPSRQY